MIASAHVSAGAVAGLLAARIAVRPAASYALAVAFGLVSHVLMDAAPHSDYAGLPRAAVYVLALAEVVVTVTILAVIVKSSGASGVASRMLAGFAGAVLPDFRAPAELLLPHRKGEITRLAEEIHFFHAPEHDARMLGLVVEILLTIGLLLWCRRLLSSRRRALPG